MIINRLFLILLLLFPLPAWATTYYVSTSGSNGNSCSTAQTCTSSSCTTAKGTITGGISCLSGAGDTLLIRSGTYNESVSTPAVSGSSWSNPVWVGAYPNETVTLQALSGDHTLGVGGGGDYVIFDRLHVRGDYSFYAVAAGGTGGRVRFQNGEITSSTLGGGCDPDFTISRGYVVYINPGGTETQFINNDVHDSPCGYGFYVHAANVLIDGNRIYGNAGFGIQIYNGATGDGMDDNIVRNNIIYNNGFTLTFAGITAWHGQRNHFFNNVIYGNADAGIALGTSTSDYLIYNNTIYNNVGSAISVGASSDHDTLIKNNILYNNLTDIDDNGTGTSASNNLTSNPSFVDASGGDFHLQAGSAAIDTGTTLTEVTTDADGVSRPQGSAYDRGAYEFASGGPPPSPALQIAWALNEGTGTSVADTSGNSYTGTTSGSPTWVLPGLVGAAGLALNGTSQYVSQSSFPWASGQAVTVSLWLVAAGSHENGGFGIGSDNIPNTFGAHLPWSDNTLYWDYGDLTGDGRLSVDFTPYLGQRVHVLLTSAGAAGSSMAIWLNNVQVATSSVSDSPGVDLTGLTLGQERIGATTYYQSGTVDHFKIYNYVVTRPEVTGLYAEGVPQGPAPIFFPY